MRERLDELVVSLKKRRPERGPAQDIPEAIDIILKHIDVHGANLWGHAIRLPERAGGGVRLVVRTNFPAEHFLGSSSTMSGGVAAERTSPRIWSNCQLKPFWFII
jgi:hypothetical protein